MGYVERNSESESVGINDVLHIQQSIIKCSINGNIERWIRRRTKKQKNKIISMIHYLFYWYLF